MTIGILQPGYLPWLGFFEQLYKADVFVMYDDVQYDRNGWRNRNRIKTAGGAAWLSVPVHAPFKERPLITEVRINNTVDWRKKHFFSIQQNYSQARYFKEYIHIFEEAYARDWEYLVDIDIHFIISLADCLGMKDKQMVRSSTLGIEGGTIERLITICKKFGAETFYEGKAGRDYIDAGLFEREGIRLEFQDYRHPVYQQLFGPFIPQLSVIDLIFNHGPQSLGILLNTHTTEVTHET